MKRMNEVTEVTEVNEVNDLTFFKTYDACPAEITHDHAREHLTHTHARRASKNRRARVVREQVAQARHTSKAREQGARTRARGGYIAGARPFARTSDTRARANKLT